MKDDRNPGTGRDVHYMYVLAEGPLITIRTPFPMPIWRSILKGLTPVLHSHGLTQKGVLAIEGHLPYPNGPFTDEELTFAKRLDAAYKGEKDKLPTWWLYDWRDGEFILVRKPSKKVE